jgi:hypothetical protein
MAGQIRENLEIPRPDTVDRDIYLREIARLLLEGVKDLDKDLAPTAAQYLRGIVHYLLGRVHDRPDLPREQCRWRGKALLVSLMHGVLVRQRETMGDSSEALQGWLTGLVQECEAGKFNPLTIRSFKSMSRAQPRQAAKVMDLVERSLRLEMGMPA